MLNCYEKSTQAQYPIYLVTEQSLAEWLSTQSLQNQFWLDRFGFKAKPGSYCFLPDSNGQFAGVLLGLKDIHDVWQLGALPLIAPQGTYYIATELSDFDLQQALLAWGMGAYQFTRYKKPDRSPARLAYPKNAHIDLIENIVDSIYWVRNLINTPAADMTPLDLAEEAFQLAKQYHATMDQIVGEELIEAVYPAIYTVGQASHHAPRLIDIHWGNPAAPKLTLVGKGVCFDSGGLDIKNNAGMLLMKKDMGGAAHALGLARMIMHANLPVSLRVLIPAVENSISGNAYRPGDIITMRNGKTVEITNTDAEGRLVLADALVEACHDKPDLLIDFATLTGAARIALGTDIAAMFTNREALGNQVMAFAKQNIDPIWPLPLYNGYLNMLNSTCADLINSANSSYAGAITAALFLQEFVESSTPWLHFDLMAWNLTYRPGHPIGAEAMALRALFDYLRQRFSAQH